MVRLFTAVDANHFSAAALALALPFALAFAFGFGSPVSPVFCWRIFLASAKISLSSGKQDIPTLIITVDLIAKSLQLSSGRLSGFGDLALHQFCWLASSVGPMLERHSAAQTNAAQKLHD
eukprot:s523_g10.t1